MGSRGSTFSKTGGGGASNDDGGNQSVSKWGWTSYYKAELQTKVAEDYAKFYNQGEGLSLMTFASASFMSTYCADSA